LNGKLRLTLGLSLQLSLQLTLRLGLGLGLIGVVLLIVSRVVILLWPSHNELLFD
jgi:hypothetical protein